MDAPLKVADRDLNAFLIYATRERSLDASARAAMRYGNTDERLASIADLREVNRSILFRETRRRVEDGL